MGLTISLAAELPLDGAGRPISSEAAFERIRGVIARLPGMDDPLVQSMVSSAVATDEAGDEEMLVSLHPGAEQISIRVVTGWLMFSAKTSTLGPGYHRAVVDLADGITQAGFEWHRDDENPENVHRDETGYFERRDIPGLVAQMTAAFGQLMQIVVREAANGASGIALNFRFGESIPQMRDTLTVLGPRSLQWCASAAKKPEAFVEQFYPWWSPGRDATFWRSTGLSMLWTDIRWHPAASAEEQAEMELAVACLERARQLNPAITLPEAELAELRSLIAASEDSESGTERAEEFTPPNPAGIGYRRGKMTAMLTGGWGFTFPGYYYTAVEDDGACEVWHFGPRTLRISTASLGDAMKQTDLAAAIPPDFEKVTPMKGWALGEKPEHKSEEPDTDYWVSSFWAQAPASIAFVTACYDDPADIAWARSLVATLTPPAPGEGSGRV